MRFALVKWVSGKDNGKLTVLETVWIKDFDDQNVDYNETYIIEWKSGKEPPAGWPVYDGKILKISDSRSQLSKHLADLALEMYAGEASATKSKEPKRMNVSDAGESSEEEIPKERTKKSKKRKSPKEDTTREIITGAEWNASRDGVLISKPVFETLLTIAEESLKLQKGMRRELDTANLPEMKRLLEKMCKRSRNKSGDGDKANAGDSQVEIYPGTGVCVDALTWARVNRLASGTAVARTLLMKLFSTETLANSNLKGGAAKNKLGQGAVHKALDANIYGAIEAAAMKKDPTLTKGACGQAVSNKITWIRSQQKK